MTLHAIVGERKQFSLYSSKFPYAIPVMKESRKQKFINICTSPIHIFVRSKEILSKK
jgi:hypothetical protein